MQKRPKREDGNTPCSASKLGFSMTLAANLTLADLNWLQVRPDCCANTRPARIANRNGAIMGETSAEHPPTLILVTWNENNHVRNTTKISNVIGPCVGRAVGAHQARAIECKKDREILQRDVMNQLIVTTLQKRRINRDNRLEPFTGNAGCKRHGVLFRDTHIKISRWKLALEVNQA